MKIRVERDGLADAVAWVARSLPARPSVPVLGGILLDAGAATSDDAKLTIAGFDYEVSAIVDIPATITTEGKALVSGRLLADITKALPNQPVEISVDNARMSINCGSAKFSLPTMPVEDYPQLPAMPERAGKVDGQVFAEAVAQVAIAAGKDDTLPMLTGVRLAIDGDKVTMVATDRFRLAQREFDWAPESDAVQGAVLVPAKTLSDSAKTLGTTGAEIELSLVAGEGLLGISGTGKATTTRLLDAEFPPYQQLLTNEQTATVIIEAAQLADAIKRVSLVADRGAQVRLEFTENELRLSASNHASNAEESSAEEVLPIELAGESISIGFNPSYLLDGLSAVRTAKAQLAFTSPNRPALIKPIAEDETVLDGYLYLLMPVRLPN